MKTGLQLFSSLIYIQFFIYAMKYLISLVLPIILPYFHTVYNQVIMDKQPACL